MKQYARFLAIVICASIISVFSCATGERVKEISPGMTKFEVESILGKPDGYQKQGSYEAYKYTNRLISGWSWDRTDYFVIFKDGLVEEYGNGEVRERNVGGITAIYLIPLK